MGGLGGCCEGGRGGGGSRAQRRGGSKGNHQQRPASARAEGGLKGHLFEKGGNDAFDFCQGQTGQPLERGLFVGGSIGRPKLENTAGSFFFLFFWGETLVLRNADTRPRDAADAAASDGDSRARSDGARTLRSRAAARTAPASHSDVAKHASGQKATPNNKASAPNNAAGDDNASLAAAHPLLLLLLLLLRSLISPTPLSQPPPPFVPLACTAPIIPARSKRPIADKATESVAGPTVFAANTFATPRSMSAHAAASAAASAAAATAALPPPMLASPWATAGMGDRADRQQRGRAPSRHDPWRAKKKKQKKKKGKKKREDQT